MFRVVSLLGGGALAALLAMPALAARGTDGAAKIIFWQAPSMMNPYLAGADKEATAASLVLEPLAGYDENGNLLPRLAVDIPTADNGGISEDQKSITWKLKPGLKWSDGTPFTAKDVVFTASYCMDPKGGCAQLERFRSVDKVEALNDLTVRVIFKEPKPVPYAAFVGAYSPILQAKQFADCLGIKAPTCTDANFYPIGTGPFVVTSFKPNDAIALNANPNYRDPDKPHFAEVNFKGGGDALGAARAVLQTGEYDYGLNLSLASGVLKNMEEAGKGKMLVGFGSAVQMLLLNLTDPSNSLPQDQRSTVDHPNPILGDIRVRKALSMALDRARLTEIGYGSTGKPTCDVIPAPKNFAADSTICLKQDIPGARQLLDEAGWKPGADGIREKDGKKLNLKFVTTNSAVDHKFQAILKQWWREIGVNAELRSIDSSVFFGSDPGNPDTIQKFYADVTMWANWSAAPDPATYFATSYSCRAIPSPATQWQGWNIARYCDPEFSALISDINQTANYEKRGELARKLNSTLTNSYSVVPLVWRGFVSAASNTLSGNIMNAWDSQLWNAQDWYRKK